MFAIANSGALQVETGKSNKEFAFVVAAFIAMGSVTQIGSHTGWVGFLLAGVTTYFSAIHKPDQHLSVGAGDGQKFFLVSKDKRFLTGVLSRLRK